MYKLRNKQTLPFAEFVTLMAMMMSLVALSIDAVLPALPYIENSVNVTNQNDMQLVVGFIFLGMALGQLFYGPLSDAWGRKPVIMLGMSIFAVGSICVLLADSFEIILLGRFIEGLGLGAPRVVSMALIRDIYKGDQMARVMSFAATIFILVPMIAPLLGQGVLLIFDDWHVIFIMILAIAIIVLIWFQLRQPETLQNNKRRRISAHHILAALREILSSKVAIGFTLVSGLSSGIFLAYLSSAQQIIGQQYGLEELFSLVFAALAAAIGAASYINARIVTHFGMVKIIKYSLVSIIIISLVFVGIAMVLGGNLPFRNYMVYLASMMFFTGLLFGNTNSMAMEPLGHIAGIGAAVVGAFSLLISVPLGILIARLYAGTVMPILLGFLLTATMSLLITNWAIADSFDNQ